MNKRRRQIELLEKELAAAREKSRLLMDDAHEKVLLVLRKFDELVRGTQ